MNISMPEFERHRVASPHLVMILARRLAHDTVLRDLEHLQPFVRSVYDA